MATPRTPNEDRERFKREHDDPAVKDGKHEQLLVEKPFDFIEKTDPADRLGEGFGQQTRDNVNPAIPSAEPGKGGIVDPHTLGMPQASGGPAPRVESPEPAEPKTVAGGKEAPPLPDATPDQLAARYISPNEPWGSNVGGEVGGGEPAPGEPLVLTDIDPDSIVIGSAQDFVLTVTGAGFTADCVVLFDDEEATTTLVNSTTLSASVGVALEAGIVDVEVGRGEELSDVLTFEFVAASGRRSSEKAERKPKKAEPSAKRQKKDKSKSGKR